MTLWSVVINPVTFAVLKAVFDLAIKGFPESFCTGCDIIYQFLMTLTKLRRLNVADWDLAYRFGINQSTVSRCITKWLDMLYVKLSPLIYWPDRNQLWKTMPKCFQKSLGNVQLILIALRFLLKGLLFSKQGLRPIIKSITLTSL